MVHGVTCSIDTEKYFHLCFLLWGSVSFQTLFSRLCFPERKPVETKTAVKSSQYRVSWVWDRPRKHLLRVSSVLHWASSKKKETKKQTNQINLNGRVWIDDISRILILGRGNWRKYKYKKKKRIQAKRSVKSPSTFPLPPPPVMMGLSFTGFNRHVQRLKIIYIHTRFYFVMIKKCNFFFFFHLWKEKVILFAYYLLFIFSKGLW